MSISNIEKLPFSTKVRSELQDIINYLMGYSKILMIVLFGSWSRCTQTCNSDYDIFVLVDNKFKLIDKATIRSDLNEKEIDAVIMTEAEWKTATSLLSEQIRKDGILLWKS